jgi:hypothetical protein
MCAVIGELKRSRVEETHFANLLDCVSERVETCRKQNEAREWHEHFHVGMLEATWSASYIFSGVLERAANVSIDLLMKMSPRRSQTIFRPQDASAFGRTRVLHDIIYTYRGVQASTASSVPRRHRDESLLY